jgi:hypothetical protein
LLVQNRNVKTTYSTPLRRDQQTAQSSRNTSDLVSFRGFNLGALEQAEGLTSANSKKSRKSLSSVESDASGVRSAGSWKQQALSRVCDACLSGLDWVGNDIILCDGPGLL